MNLDIIRFMPDARKPIHFTKMQGIGNDYIYIDCNDQEISSPIDEVARRLSDRHNGIGGDGVVLMLPSESADFRMQMFNADGSEGAMCGNAIRCIGKYLYEKKYTTKKELAIETGSGVRYIEMQVSEDTVKTVTVDMGEPVFDPAHIPVAMAYDQVVQVPVQFNNESFQLTAVSMGNPHAVFFVDEITDYQLFTLGPIIEKHQFFPDRTNVEFVKILNRKTAEMRVWERGSGETLACGTGACAVAVAGVVSGLLDRHVTIQLPGGELEIEWKDDNHVYKTGPAEYCYSGTVDLANHLK